MYSRVEYRTSYSVSPVSSEMACQHRLALGLVAAVRHREQPVGPVGVGRPLVAVRHAAEAGHRPGRSPRQLVLVGRFHTPMPFWTKPALRWLSTAAKRRIWPVARNRGRPRAARPDREAVRLGDRRRTARTDRRQVGLQRPDGGDVARRSALGRVGRLRASGSRRSFLAAGSRSPFMSRSTPILKKLAGPAAAGSTRRSRGLPSRSTVGIEADPRVRRHGDREPDVEVVVAPVVVGDARVRREDGGRHRRTCRRASAPPRAGSCSPGGACRRSRRSAGRYPRGAGRSIRSRISSSGMPMRSPSAANGRATSGRSFWSSSRRSRSRSSILAVSQKFGSPAILSAPPGGW